MLFKTVPGRTLLHGRLEIDPKTGTALVVDDQGARFVAREIDFVVPDNEEQGAYAVSLGFNTHTPLSMVLGAGSTES